VEAAPVVDAESEVIVGGAPGAGPMVKRTIFDISVVVVLLELLILVPELADPGICTAICTVPGVLRSDEGTGAVSWMPLTRVVVSAVLFQRMSAPAV